MPNFSIIKKSEVSSSFRAKKIMNSFDLEITEVVEEFKGEINLEKNDWKKGLIIGASGTGKTTILREVFGETATEEEFKGKSVVDDFDKNMTIDEITKLFFSVGFSSVPDWLKPYQVLSNGQKMRVELAKKLSSDKEIVAYDEFTSFVDRDVAKTLCIALDKFLKNSDKKFIGVSCHYDVEDFLEPDWVFDTNEMKFRFSKKKEKNTNTKSEVVKKKSGISLKNIII